VALKNDEDGRSSDGRPDSARGWEATQRSFVRTGLLVGGAALIGAFCGVAVQSWLDDDSGSSDSPSTSAEPGACDSRAIASDVLPSIVTISAKGRTESGTGSGEIVDAKGLVVTNDHVIAAAADGGSFEVLLADGTSEPAELVGRDPKTDLAVLRIEPESDLPVISFGDATALHVGEPVVALGAPLGLSGSVTAGIVSALDRNVPVPKGDGGQTVLAGAIQTDASINPGNSGGALVDCEGHLVGVNTAILTVPNEVEQAGGGSVGIGFAIPSETVQSITSQLVANGRATHPTFGMAVSLVPETASAQFGATAGLYVESVTPGGPADRAGLRRGDIITTIDGQPATQPNLIPHLLATSSAGDSVDLEYVRSGSQATTTVTLVEG
jgi:putative serine protease PepD